MSLPTLRSELRDTKTRAMSFRQYLRILEPADRSLFFSLARNSPGPGRFIEDPRNHGFVEIHEASPDVVGELVLDSPSFAAQRLSLFERVVGLTHRVSRHFHVYVGRSYVREDHEHRGPLQRWRAHREVRHARFATILGRVPTDRIERDEALAIALLKCWDAHDALCCNSSVLNIALNAAGSIADDAEQVLYMCLTPRRGGYRE